MRLRQPVLGAAGLAGRVRCGYQEAAAIGAWRLTLDALAPRRYALDAAARVVSAYWLGERPLTVELMLGRDRWTWTPSEIVVEGGRARAVLSGPPAVDRLAA